MRHLTDVPRVSERNGLGFMVDNGCKLCAFGCGVDRVSELGVCKCSDCVKVALASVHLWEEPCISGCNGSGTVFFSGCNFDCVFCQNFKISHENFGKVISDERLAEIFLELQGKNVHNINLVSPTPYVHNIIHALDIARARGLNIPIVYNTNSYENVETLKLLEGYVDVYLPDLKYFDDDTAIKFSKAPKYFDVATTAIKEMVRQVGTPVFDDNGIIQKGVIVRHLVLPSHLTETKKILDWIKCNLPKEIYVSVMAQYFPTYKAKNDALFSEIGRKLNRKEYALVCNMLKDIENGYIQDLEEFEEEYVPNFDLSNV